MTEGFTLTLKADADWRLLGSTPEKAATEVVVRSFDRDVLVATGATPSKPDSAPITVRAGAGGRVLGLHVFAKPSQSGGACRILVRGV